MISKNRIKYLRSLNLKKNRKREGVFVAEGWKVVGELLCQMECVYLGATDEWFEANGATKVPIIDHLTEDELRSVSFQETPQQVIAVFKQKETATTLAEASAGGLCLILDDVQNPGNLGTIVRLADWFGIEHIFCSHGCADIYNPKTVQATMGAIARVQIHYTDLDAELSSLPVGTPVYGTFLDGDNIYSKSLTQHGVIIMGNEGNGVSDTVAAHVSERLFIPNYPADRSTSESLNVAIATAIICAEFRRPRP